jgi:sRNA-binding protein
MPGVNEVPAAPADGDAAAAPGAESAAEEPAGAPTGAATETPTEAPTEGPIEAAPSADAGTAASPRSEPSLADTARQMAEQFPALFGPGVVKPVKLRIQADIQQRTPGVFTKKALSLFLHRHTTGSAYLRALLAAESRFDLDGQPAGEIAPEHKEAARVEVERRRAIVEAKKEAGRAAARAAREAARPPRPPRPEGQGRPDRPPRGDRPGRPDRQDRPFAGPRPDRPPRPARDEHLPRPDAAPAVPLTPEQAAEAEARRQRAQLLRTFEQSPLSKANFGALKGLSEAALDALLAQARADRERR